MKKLIYLILIILTVALMPMVLSEGHYWYFSDFFKQQIPFILETKRLLLSGHPWWSWNTFTGDNFIGSYSFYTVTSPFVWLCCLFPADKILWGVLLNLYLKTCCTGAFAYLYFKKVGFSKELCILGGLMYCLSSFYICNLFYFHFCEPIMMFPLLHIAIEKVLNKERRCYFWLGLTVFGVVFINFYFAYASLLLGGMYFFLKGYYIKQLNSKTIIKTIASVLLGTCMAAIILLPTLLHMSGGPRISFHLAWQLRPTFIISTILGHMRSIILPSCSEWTSMLQKEFCSMEAFIPVFGILPAVLYCIHKRDWLSRLIVILIIIYFTPLNGIFTCFTNPFYHRWNYGFDIFLILATLHIVKNKNSITRKDFNRYIVFCISFIIVMLGLIIIYYNVLKRDTAALRHYVLLTSDILLFGINCICLAQWVNKHITVNRLILLTGICGGLNLFASFTLCAFWEYAYLHPDKLFRENDIVYRDIFSSHLKDTPVAMKYRADFITDFNNIAQQKNEPGIFGFHSVMNNKMMQLRSIVDDNIALPEFKCLGYRDAFSTLFSVRQVFDYRDPLTNRAKYENSLQKVASCERYDTYVNKNYIPIGFTYTHYLSKDDLTPYVEKKDSVNIPLLMLDNLVVKDEDAHEISKYLSKGTIDTSVRLDSLAGARRQRTVTDFIGTSEGFSCKSDFKNPEIVFFSVVADPGFTAYIDNHKTKIYEVNLGLSAIIVPPGKHDIRFDYFPPGLKLGAIISLCSFIILLLVGFSRNSFAVKCRNR